jgi:KDO2-lipid IV(A) lauroyltransferase
VVNEGAINRPRARSAREAQPTALQRFLGSRIATGAGMFLSRYAPPFLGYAGAGLIAALITRLKPGVYWVVFANLRQVMGGQADEKTLHRLTRRVFHNNARNTYDLWRLVSRGREAIRAAVYISPEVRLHIEQGLQRGKGVIIAGTHTGNFDLGILALAAHGLDLQVLGLAAPPGGGFHLMDQMRARAGVRLTSINVSSLREAMSRLRAGGIVLTGVDRPVGDEEATVEFFGRPALLPTGHVRLALKTDAVILAAGNYRDREQGNAVRLSPPIEMIRTGDPQEDLRDNLRRVNAYLEEYIRAWPDQWALFLPVWPEQAAPVAR